MNRIAIVSLGNGGTQVMKEMLRYEPEADMYCVNSRRELENVKYYSYEELEVLADVLAEYDAVVMMAKMGSKGGEALTELHKLLENRKICFLITPFYFEVEKMLISRSQISKIVDENFEGAILSQSSMLEIDEPDWVANSDRQMAEMILDFIPELQ